MSTIEGTLRQNIAVSQATKSVTRSDPTDGSTEVPGPDKSDPGLYPTSNVFETEDLVVRLGPGTRQRTILDRVSVRIADGLNTCIIGASGSGKSILLKSMLGILPGVPGIVSGHIKAKMPDGTCFDLLEDLERYVKCSRQGAWRVNAQWLEILHERMLPLWGRVVGYMTQHGSDALDPTRPIGASLQESIRRRLGRKPGRKQLEAEAEQWLKALHFEHPGDTLRLYPGQLSGGMAQRAVLAVVLARGATVLFADEPTTGLDPDAKAALLSLFRELKAENRLKTLVMVTHDFGVVRQLADQVIVIDAGRVVECQAASPLFGDSGPQHPVTKGLLEEYHRLSGRVRRQREQDSSSPPSKPRLEVRNLNKRYRRSWWTRDQEPVLKDVRLVLHPGEIVGLVGPSGCGKTTLAACLVRMVNPESGEVLLEGEDLLTLDRKILRQRRKRIQLLYQQPAAAIHPRMRVEEALNETARHLLGLKGDAARAQVDRVLEEVRMTERRSAFPSQLSGGQLRRVGLARVLMLRPRVLLADEPTAGVDASLRAELLELLAALCDGDQETSILLISHNRRVIRHVADRVYDISPGTFAPVERPTLHGVEDAARADWRERTT